MFKLAVREDVGKEPACPKLKPLGCKRSDRHPEHAKSVLVKCLLVDRVRDQDLEAISASKRLTPSDANSLSPCDRSNILIAPCGD